MPSVRPLLLIDVDGVSFRVDDPAKAQQQAREQTMAQAKSKAQTLASGAGVSIAAGSAWELVEYGAMRLGANGMDLTYDDTMADLFDGWVGALAGAAFTLTRVPQEREKRNRRGWRGVLGLRQERPAL